MRLLASALLVLMLAAGCSDRPRRNPLDPAAAQADRGRLQALAGNGLVTLCWDYTQYDDVVGVRLWRRLPGGGVEQSVTGTSLDRRVTTYDDLDVVNGTTYEYTLSLIIDGQTERRLDPAVRVTPGPDVVWVADAATGLVWQVTADGRAAWFSQGRFPAISGLAFDALDGSCWVSDQYLSAVGRVSGRGQVRLQQAPGRQPRQLALDSQARRGWLIDPGPADVCWWPLDADADTLALHAVDARFTDPVSIAAADGGCYVADRAAGRVLFWSPDGRRTSWDGLDRPMLLAVGGGQVWVLTADNSRMVTIGADGIRQCDLPLAPVLGMAWDRAADRLWVLGSSEVVTLGPDGAVQNHWAAAGAAPRSLAIAADGAGIWLATTAALWRLSPDGLALARLEGFAGAMGVVGGRVGPAAVVGQASGPLAP